MTLFPHHIMDDMHKAYIETSSHERGIELQNVSQLGGTDADEHEMRILGRTQQLNVCLPVNSVSIPVHSPKPQRNFRFISTLGFACTLMSTWEIALM